MDKELIEKIQSRKHYQENIECLEKHIDKYFKSEEITVFHELVSYDFHLDVYYIRPENRKYNILLTSGMSLLEMHPPQDMEDRNEYLFSELLLILPKDIEFEQVHTGNEKNGWIISMLKQTARFPHHYDTWLGIGHTLQATYDLQPYDQNTDFIGCVILPSVTLDEEFTRIECMDRIININSIFPLYKNELEYKLENGFNKFFDLLIEGDVKEAFNNERANLLAI